MNEEWGGGARPVRQTMHASGARFNRHSYGAIFYKLNKLLRAQLNVENIISARYYPTADGNDNITPSSPRAARLSITASY